MLLGTAVLWDSPREAGGQAARLGCPSKGPHYPGRSFVELLPGFVLGCLQDVPEHLLEAGSAQELCPNGSRDHTAHSQAECPSWLYTPEHLHVVSCCTSGHTSHSSR